MTLNILHLFYPIHNKKEVTSHVTHHIQQISHISYSPTIYIEIVYNIGIRIVKKYSVISYYMQVPIPNTENGDKIHVHH